MSELPSQNIGQVFDDVLDATKSFAQGLTYHRGKEGSKRKELNFKLSKGARYDRDVAQQALKDGATQQEIATALRKSPTAERRGAMKDQYVDLIVNSATRRNAIATEGPQPAKTKQISMEA